MKIRILCAMLFAIIGAASAATKTGLPFIHDDYPGALAEAKQRGLPIFVECWAPW